MNRSLVYAFISVFMVDYMVAAVVSITFTLAKDIIFVISG